MLRRIARLFARLLGSALRSPGAGGPLAHLIANIAEDHAARDEIDQMEGQGRWHLKKGRTGKAFTCFYEAERLKEKYDVTEQAQIRENLVHLGYPAAPQGHS